VFLHVKTHHLSGGAQKAPHAPVLLAAKWLTGKKRVLSKNKWKLVVFQNIFSLFISKSKPFLIYSHTLV
jgi:hypothetical protein